MTEQSVHQEVIVILNVDTLKNRASKHMKQKLTQLKERNKFTIIDEYFQLIEHLVKKSRSI